MELLRTKFPSIKVIHLVRHPAGYLKGCLKRGIEEPKEIIDGWVRYNTSARQCGEVLGDDGYLLVRFEQLVADPIGTMSQVYRFLGFPDDINDETLHINKDRLHIVGNPMKESFKKIEPHFVEIPEVETQWREYIRKRIRGDSWLQDMYFDY